MINNTMRKYLLLFVVITTSCSQPVPTDRKIDWIKLQPTAGYIIGDSVNIPISIDSLSYVDEDIQIILSSKGGLFFIQLSNLTEETIYIDWDLGSFINSAENNYRIVPGETRVILSRSIMPATVIAPLSKIEMFAVPLNEFKHILNLEIPTKPNLSLADNLKDLIFILDTYKLEVVLYNFSLKNLSGVNVGLLLSIKIRDQIKEYLLRMNVEYIDNNPNNLIKVTKKVEKKDKRSPRERSRRK